MCPLDFNTEPASTVQLVDAHDDVISSLVVRFCTAVENVSVTIAAGATYRCRPSLPVNGGGLLDHVG